MCGRQPGSLATGSSYLRLVQTKRREGLIFLGVRAVAAGWAELSSHAQKSGFSQGCCCVSVSILLTVFCGTERFSACSHGFWGADGPLALEGWEARPERCQDWGGEGYTDRKVPVLSQQLVMVPVCSVRTLGL